MGLCLFLSYIVHLLMLDMDHLIGSLKTFVQQLSYADPTLYLSNQHLHKLCIIDKNFEATEKIMVAMKHAIKVLHQDATPKLCDLKSALPALTYHENHRKFIPIVMQVVRTVRNCDQATIASEILVKLLTHRDCQIRTEAHLQLHCLVQDILGTYLCKLD